MRRANAIKIKEGNKKPSPRPAPIRVDKEFIPYLY
jgi:hypothetical protein